MRSIRRWPLMQIAAMLALAGLLPLSATASDYRGENIGQIHVVGTAQADVAPTEAHVTVGVQIQEPEAALAMRVVSAKMEAVLEDLQALGLAMEDIQTSRLSIDPVWTPLRQNNGPDTREITGFVASNSLDLRIKDLDRLGEVLDAVLKSGVNDLRGLRFTHGEVSKITDSLRIKAAEDAIRKARQLAETSGMALGSVREIRDQGASAPAPMMRMEMAAMASDMPIAQGSISMSHQVSMVFDIHPIEGGH